MELGRVGIGGKESAMWMNVNSDTRTLKNIGRVGGTFSNRYVFK